MSASLNITLVENGKKSQKAITNVSETATDAELYNFAKSFTQLSTYTFGGVKKIVTTTLTEPEVNNNG